MSAVGAGPDRFVLTFPAAPLWVATARLFAAAVARQLGCAEETVEDLKLGISESCAILVRGAGDGGALHLSLVSADGRLGVDVRGGPPMPEEALSEESTPESFARSASVQVLRALFPEAEMGPASGETRITFDMPIHE